MPSTSSDSREWLTTFHKNNNVRRFYVTKRWLKWVHDLAIAEIIYNFTRHICVSVVALFVGKWVAVLTKEIDVMRKTIISTVALLALAAMPAVAQTSRTSRTTGPMVNSPIVSPSPYARPNTRLLYGAEAYAAVPGARGPIMQPGIYDDCGQYVGWDPDPNIRFQLLREACLSQGN